ncbi:putative transporter [uncultured Alistipes sp.]|uniref:putative transporter n=1 Tax=uncultured Alistipes sp. TaxID=538949 RepID=UPI00261A30E1|nr:putative transporter [uncultured Alistipes sp.]
MNWFYSLFFGDSLAHSIFVLASVITVGILLGKIKIGGVSLGTTWILFIGIATSHFGMTVTPEVLHFVKEFGLILFVYSIGLQVGPGFFASFKHGGLQLVGLASLIVVLGVATAYILHLTTGTPIPTMVGILSGAVTNTPGLGAAQQAYTDATGFNDTTIATGYAVAYPLGVVGIIFSMIFVRYALRVRFEKEDEALAAMNDEHKKYAEKISVQFTNAVLDGRTVGEVKELINRSFVISRIADADNHIVVATSENLLHLGDKLLIVCSSEDTDAIVAFLGRVIDMPFEEWGSLDSQLVSRRILITKPSINGKKFSDLHLRTKYGINITRVNRAGVDLIPYQGMELQVGDRVMVVGSEKAIAQVADVLGNSLRKLREPNLIMIFLGIALGVLLGSIPLLNIPQPVKLGLAGGPLIVAILIGRFGTHFHLVTYTTMSANLMLREVGITLFLAAVGLGAGSGFIEAVVNGGYRWVGYGAIITVIPLLIVSFIARLGMKLNYYTLMGLIAGSTTDPPALAYANATAGNDMPAVSYATVYPVVMFLRVLTAQIFILFAL